MARIEDLVGAAMRSSWANLLGDGFVDAASFADRYGFTSAAINAALAVSNNVWIGPYTWDLSTEILVTTDYTHLHFENATLKAQANSINLIHWCASYGLVDGIFNTNANSKTGLTGYRVTPLSESQTTTLVYQIYNKFTAKCTFNGLAEGVVLQCGPTVTGSDSGSYYNEFSNILCLNCTRGIWLKNGVNSSAGNNRNTFYNCRVGQTTNTGLMIDSGDTNGFIRVNFEGISSGATPSATPTAAVVKQAGTYSGDNNSNLFLGCVIEGCTRHFNNDNAYTRIDSCDYDWTKSLMSKNPRSTWGTDLSVIPFIFGDYLMMQAGGQITPYINGVNWFADHALQSSKQMADQSGSTWYNWQTYTLTTSNCSNTTSITTGTLSKYNRFNNMLEWQFRVAFQATVAGTVIRINVPLAPDSTTYLNNSTTGPMRFPVIIQNGSGVQVVASAQLSDHTVGTTYLEFPVPAGNWDAGGANNQIHGQVRWHV